MITLENKHLFIVGDIHGEINTLVYNITKRYNIKDSAIIIAGDVGIGFNNPGWYEEIYDKNRKSLESSKNTIYCIRGNHDDPEYFNGSKKLDFQYFKTLSDYEDLVWNDKIILPIGGAVSVDRDFRITENERLKSLNSDKRCWWSNEKIIKLDNFNNLPGHIDIVISHEAPFSCGPVLIKTDDMDQELYDDIKEERDYLQKIVREKLPERWYFGHYHDSFSGTCVNTNYRGLDIQEIIEVIYYE